MDWMVLCVLVISSLTVSGSSQSKMEGFIVGGNFAKIEEYPHSAFLKISCDLSNYICGSSIVNQYLLLTAAHCIHNCSNMHLTVMVGNENRYQGLPIGVRNITIHENYEAITSKNDIAMILLDGPLILSNLVKRVSLLRDPPMDKEAFVAGWGRINEMRGTEVLMYTSQRVISRKACYNLLGWIPRGCFCGMHPNNNNTYVARGDSGSALVVDGHIQIGIVSHKYPTVTIRVVIYTDVAYFYDWIIQTAHDLYCTFYGSLTQDQSLTIRQ